MLEGCYNDIGDPLSLSTGVLVKWMHFMTTDL